MRYGRILWTVAVGAVLAGGALSASEPYRVWQNHWMVWNGYRWVEDRDPRDNWTYSAEGWGVPVSVPIAPNVRHHYNYSWGVPASRITKTNNPYQQYLPNSFYSLQGSAEAQHGMHPPVSYVPTDTTQKGFYYQTVPSWVPAPKRHFWHHTTPYIPAAYTGNYAAYGDQYAGHATHSHAAPSYGTHDGSYATPSYGTPGYGTPTYTAPSTTAPGATGVGPAPTTSPMTPPANGNGDSIKVPAPMANNSAYQRNYTNYQRR